MNHARALVVPAFAALLLAGCSPSKDSCRSPSFMCNGKCIDGSRDPSNCGGCGVTCTGSQTCCGSCVDLQTSAYHCGACDARCPVEGVCTAGACSCPPARPDQCGTNPGTCVNLQSGLGGYCGTCGVVCQGTGVAGTDATCTAGACVCSGAATDCSSTSPAIVCVNTTVDPVNCGGCGLHCAPHATCASNGAPTPSGVCGCGDPAFPDSCGAGPGGAGCVNFATDPAHCGGCATACPGSAPACSNGHCCPSGQGFCSGACVDTRSSPTNCGVCGHACGAGQVCSAGSCVCSTGQIACGSTCCAPGAGCCTGLGGVTTCMTGHGNGLGQTFFDCTTTLTGATTTKVTASEAAVAWGATSQLDATTFCGFPCWAGQKSGQCAIWCYGTDDLGHLNASQLAGRVLAISTPSCSALACPTALTGFDWPSP